MNMLRALVEKVGIMQEQMGNVNRKTVSVRKTKKDMLEIQRKHYNKK